MPISSPGRFASDFFHGASLLEEIDTWSIFKITSTGRDTSIFSKQNFQSLFSTQHTPA
jgi:hypothetical protein